MQLNLYGILSVALALSSIFLPWVSSSYSFVCIYGMAVCSMDVAPHVWSTRSSFCPTNCSSFSLSYDTDWKWMPWPRMYSRWSLFDTLKILLVAAFLIYTHSICLTIHGIFANGSWGRVGRQTMMVGGLLFLSSILLYLISLFMFLDIHLGIENGLSIKSGIAIARFTYFNIGLLVALLSTLLTFLSCIRPRFVNLSTGISIEGYDKLRDFFSIPEKEKLLAIFLSSFLVVLLFTIFYFILPTIKF